MEHDFTNTILISSPTIKDGIFHKKVIYVHTDDSAGSTGIVLNSPMDSRQAIEWSNEIGWRFPNRIYLGGPVNPQLGYIIHSEDYTGSNTVKLTDSLNYTGGKYIVDDINKGAGPSQFLLLTGYCSWSPGQLEKEVNNKFWIPTEYDMSFFFQNMSEDKVWEHSVNLAAQMKASEILSSINK